MAENAVAPAKAQVNQFDGYLTHPHKSHVSEKVRTAEPLILARYAEGTSVRAIARETGINPNSIVSALKRNGFEPRTHAEASVLRQNRRAKPLITNYDPSKSISSQVAAAMGFESTSGLRDNRQFRTAVMRECMALDPEKYRKISTQRAKHRNRIPKWADKRRLHSFYRMANDLGLTVDHIVPLQGTLICGLHVENNLQLMSYSDNCAKGNRFSWTSDPLIGPPTAMVSDGSNRGSTVRSYK